MGLLYKVADDTWGVGRSQSRVIKNKGERQQISWITPTNIFVCTVANITKQRGRLKLIWDGVLSLFVCVLYGVLRAY